MNKMTKMHMLEEVEKTISHRSTVWGTHHLNSKKKPCKTKISQWSTIFTVCFKNDSKRMKLKLFKTNGTQISHRSTIYTNTFMKTLWKTHGFVRTKN